MLNVILKPTPFILVFFAILVVWVPIVGVLTWVYHDGQVYGTIISAGALLVWASVATLRIELHSNRLEKKVLWRTQWRIDLADASLREGLGGDIPFIPAIIISDRRTGKKVGEILKPQFKTSDLAVLQAALASIGVEISPRKNGRRS